MRRLYVLILAVFLVCTAASTLYAQAPGGVTTGLLMWHKADDGTATPGTKTTWADVSGNGRDVTQPNNAAYEPSLILDAVHSADNKNYFFNFNPFYYFDGGDFFYRDAVEIGDYFPASGAGSVYGIMYNGNDGGWRTPYGWGDDDPNLVRNGERYQVWRDGGFAFEEDLSLTSVGAHIGGMTWSPTGNSGIYLNFNGAIYSTTTTHIGTINDRYFAVGSEGASLTGAGNERFIGGLPEVFAYSVDHENSAGDEKLRINSYLAIKYGITLQNSAGTGTSDYLSSAAVNVWNATANTGYGNNVFGIARDDASALHQKQSRSANNNQKLLVGKGSSLFNINSANTNDLLDGQFLLVGDNGLKQQLATPLVYTAGANGATNFRFEAIWKVQNTDNVGNVTVAWPKRISNLHVVRSADDNFDASDDFIPMTDEVIINGVTYNTATIALNDGDYFTFAGFTHAPGGVTADLRLWLKADEGFSPDTWQDFSIHENDYTQTNTNRQPFVATEQFNFNPIIDFGGSTSADGRFMVVPSGQPFSANGLSGTFFTATLTRPGGTSGYRDILGFGGTTTTASLTNANEPAITKLNNDIVLYSSTTSAFPTEYPDNELLLTDVSYTVNVAGIKYGLNGRDASTTQTRTTGNSLQANGSILGSQGEVNNGLIGEVIAYERDLTPLEKQKVRSYLAIKNGATLIGAVDGTYDYLDSEENEVWSGTTANSDYHNNVFGIGYDEISALHQKQSKSVNEGQVLIIGSGSSLFDTNADNTNNLAEGQFLMVGDNGLRQGLSAPLAYTGGSNGEVNYRFEAIWKTQNTNGAENITIAWPKGIDNLYLVQSSDETIDNTDIFTPMTTEVTVNGVVYNTATVNAANGYFTFAGFAHAPGGVVGGLSYWYRADQGVTHTGDGTDVTAWTDVFQGTVSAQMGTNDFPKYVEGGEGYFNYNPGLTFTANNQSLGTFDARTLSSLDYDVFTFTREGMTGGGNPRFFSSLVDNNETSGSIDYWDALGFFPDGRIERITNAYTSRYFLNPGNIDFDPDIPSIMYHTFTDISMSKGLSGAENGSEYVNNNARGYMNGGHVFGSTQFSSNGSDNAGFVGDIGETVIYGAGSLTETERRRVDSYLAIKYGITLGRVETDHYLASDETIVWDGSIATAYNNNIFGVAKDDIGVFEQKVSRSVNAAGSMLTVATTNNFTLPNADASRTGFTNDKTYFLLGDNNVTATPLVDLTVAGNDGQRIQRIWLAQRTNTPGALYVEADLSAYGTTFEEGNNVYMLVADDADFTTNATETSGTFVDGKWVFSYDFDDDAALRYITFAEVDIACSGPDSDGDGIPDMCDLDMDNDGILNADECGESNLIIRGDFTNLPSSPGFMNPTQFAAANPGWTFATTGSGTDAEILWNNMTDPLAFGNGIRFQRDGSTQSLTQSISGWHHGGNPQLIISRIAANNSNPAGYSSTLTVSYAGVEYVRIVTTDGAGNGATITYSNGATSSLTSFAVGTIYDNWVIELPFDAPAAGDLTFGYLAGPHDSDDFALGDIIVNACRDTDGDGILDLLDLDSDGDGCPDAIEGGGDFDVSALTTASGTIASQTPNQNFGIAVDANGIPTVVGSAGQDIGRSRDETRNDCIDTDGDGYPDWQDLDSDNDGILDTDECPDLYVVRPVTTTSITVDGTITSGNAQQLVDGEGAGGTGEGPFPYWYTNVSNLPIKFSMDLQAPSIIDHIKLYGPWGIDEWIKEFTVELYDASNALLGTESLTAPDQYVGGTILSFSQEYTDVSHIELTIISGQGYNSFNRASVNEIVFLDMQVCDTDGDGIPDYLDLDSDGDGCPDALEGDENVTLADLNPDGSINIDDTGGVDGDGVPNLVNTDGDADVGDDVGQGVGSAQDPLTNACITYCVQPGATGTPTEFTQVGISDREGFGGGWPGNVPNGFIAIESQTSGFVITRVQQVSDIADPQEGMLVYEMADQCLKLYNGTSWNCIERSCNE